MSALVQKQTCAVQDAMSALPPKADMCSAKRHVRLVPIADILVAYCNSAFTSKGDIGSWRIRTGLFIGSNPNSQLMCWC